MLKFSPHLKEKTRKLHRETTKEEKHLWYDFLRYQKPKFTRQKPIGCYIVDFYCHEKNFCIELDGLQHAETQAQIYDKKERNTLKV